MAEQKYVQKWPFGENPALFWCRQVGGGTSGQQNHGAQQQNYEAQPYCVKNVLGFTLLKPGSTLSGLGSAVLKPGFEETVL